MKGISENKLFVNWDEGVDNASIQYPTVRGRVARGTAGKLVGRHLQGDTAPGVFA